MTRLELARLLMEAATEVRAARADLQGAAGDLMSARFRLDQASGLPKVVRL